MSTPHSRTRPVNKPDLVVDHVTTRKASSVRDVTLFFDAAVNTDPYNAERFVEPLGWVNYASIELVPDDDAVKLAISVGDPRGAFVMELRRGTDGRLLIFTPHPDNGLLHLPLREVRPGVYEVGNA